jgi:hypothetical protein
MSKIFTVSLGGLIGLGLVVTGCGGDGDPGFGLTWDLALVGTNQTVACDAADTPKVTLDASGPNGVKAHDEFRCADMGGTSRVLPRGTYDVTVSLLNGGGQVVSGTTATFTLNRGGVTWLPALTFDIQSFGLTWTVVRGNQLVSCDQANARTVRFTAMLGDGKPIVYMFPCSDRAGDTTAVPLGPYSVQVDLLDPAGNPLASPMVMSVVVDNQRRAQLEPIVFTVP